MMRCIRNVASVILVGASLAGCGALLRANRTPMPDPAQLEWSKIAVQVGEEVQASRYGAADRLLVDFAARYPGSEASAQARVWRALFRLDPANGAASTREALGLIDSALATPMPAGQRADAAALRRLALALDAHPSVVTVTTPGATAPAAKSDDKARDEELARVKDELAKANAELERIKRRVAAPKP